MRKQKSIRWFRYTVEDAKAAQAELDEQAERGWELEEVGLFTATFRRAERPRRCWVEPARWKSERKKDWDARSDYLTLCGEAGWELLEEDGGLFYFRAKEGTDPAPLQTDEDVEWADVWKKALADQVWSLSYLAVYWSIWTVGGYIRVLLCKQAAKNFHTICKKETALKRVLSNLLSAVSLLRFKAVFSCGFRVPPGSGLYQSCAAGSVCIPAGQKYCSPRPRKSCPADRKTLGLPSRCIGHRW